MLIFENRNTFLAKNVFSFTDFREKEYRIAPKTYSQIPHIENANIKIAKTVFVNAKN